MFRNTIKSSYQIISIKEGNNQDSVDEILRNSQQQKQLNPKTNENLQTNERPEKKLKKQHIKPIIAGKTNEQRLIRQLQLHDKFSGGSYKAGFNIMQKPVKQQIEFQEQLAKQKYLQNVEMTRKIKTGTINTKIYRGNNNYANYKLTSDDIQNATEKYKQKCGPSRINSSVRNTCRFDYNPSLCKDWHDSGYCVFGNSCIYLHDRSNYKTGWEIERDFERTEKQRWRRIANPSLATKQTLEQILKDIQKYKVQQNCLFCHEILEQPVQIQCKHIFCTKCALKLEKCCVCQKKSHGIMNNCEKKLKKQRQIYNEMYRKKLQSNQQKSIKNKHLKTINSINVFTSQE